MYKLIIEIHIQSNVMLPTGINAQVKQKLKYIGIR